MIDAAAVDAFRRDGVVVLRGAFTGWVEGLRRGLERNMREPGPLSVQYTPAGEPGGFFGDYCNWQRIAEYEDFVLRSPAAGIAAALTASRRMRIYHEHVLVKEPGTQQRTPWHHDLPYYGLEGEQVCSLWVALDRVPRDVCPEFIAGSHAWGRRFLPRRFVNGEGYERPADGLELVPDIDAERGAYDIRAWDLAPGDAIAFHFLTVHDAPANAAARRRRRAFITRWLGDDVTYAVRSGKTSPPYPELAARLSHGDPLDVPEFPVVWPRAEARTA
ncbi:MAG: phytanoyl-CoA dioxygenase family protein [Gammaproteobacteria bacterium]|nr:phytanoyl-CoA dioxygenase family protein [Gammaproteobacteria bacterium]